MTVLFIATRNAHKVQEIQQILGEGFRCLTLNDLPGAPGVVEDANTFEGNAKKKSVELAKWLCGNPEIFFRKITSKSAPFFVLADDSGLEVDPLGGAPGVHSARFAAIDTGATGNSSDADNNAKLLRLLEKVPLEKRTARFRCFLALTRVSFSVAGNRIMPVTMQTEFCRGVCEGRISFAPSGRGGFGYDPLFVPIGYEKSFAELGEEVKNKLSHRAKALERLGDLFGCRA